MTSRPPERVDLDALLDALLPAAQKLLRNRGDFYPFGAHMKAGEGVHLVAGYTGSERPPSQEVIDLIAAGLRNRASAGDIDAAGICYDVRVRTDDGKTDAIAVALEHRAGDCVSALMPYTKGRFKGLRFGDLTAGPGERRIFDERCASCG